MLYHDTVVEVLQRIIKTLLRKKCMRLRTAKENVLHTMITSHLLIGRACQRELQMPADCKFAEKAPR